MKLYGNRGGKHVRQRPIRQKKKSRGHKGLVITLLVFLVIGFSVAALAIQHVRPPEADSTPIVIESGGEIASGESTIPAEPINPRKDDYITILLIGRDKVGLNTDVLMLMSYDMAANKVNMVSIPRDTMVNVERKNKKINSAYAQSNKGDMEELMREVESVVGFRPDRHILVSVDAFAELIDAIGGVTVNVPVDMYYSDPYQDLYIDLEEGQQHLDGNKELQLLRFISYPMADIQRTQVQRDFIQAVIDQKLTVANVGKIPEIYDAVSKNIRSSMSLAELTGYASTIMGMKELKFNSFPCPYYLNGDFVQLDYEEATEIFNRNFK